MYYFEKLAGAKTMSIFTLGHIDDIDKSDIAFEHDYVIRNGLWHAGNLALLVQPSLPFLPEIAGPSALFRPQAKRKRQSSFTFLKTPG